MTLGAVVAFGRIDDRLDKASQPVQGVGLHVTPSPVAINDGEPIVGRHIGDKCIKPSAPSMCCLRPPCRYLLVNPLAEPRKVIGHGSKEKLFLRVNVGRHPSAMLVDDCNCGYPFFKFLALSASTPGPGWPGGILIPGTRLANCISILGTAGPPVIVSAKSNGIRLPVYRPPSAHQSNSLGMKGASSLRSWLLVGSLVGNDQNSEVHGLLLHFVYCSSWRGLRSRAPTPDDSRFDHLGDCATLNSHQPRDGTLAQCGNMQFANGANAKWRAGLKTARPLGSQSNHFTSVLLPELQDVPGEEHPVGFDDGACFRSSSPIRVACDRLATTAVVSCQVRRSGCHTRRFGRDRRRLLDGTVPLPRHQVQIEPSRFVASTTTPGKPYSRTGSCVSHG